jgi:hypothetical protein
VIEDGKWLLGVTANEQECDDNEKKYLFHPGINKVI